MGTLVYGAMLLLPGMTAGAPAADPAALLEQARGLGRVPVIARLALAPWDGPETDPEGARRWGERLTAQRRRVLERLAEPVPGLKVFALTPAIALQASPRILEALQRDPEVLEVVEDAPARPSLAESVPLIGGMDGTFAGWSGAGQVVAILDTGVESGHPFLGGRVVAEACYSSSIPAQNIRPLCPRGVPVSTAPGAAQDCAETIHGCGHGTHVAGIAAGAGADFSGAARAAELIAIQVFSQASGGICTSLRLSSPCAVSYASDQIRGLEYVYALRHEFPIAAANMSLGGQLSSTPCDSDSRKPVIDRLRAAGIATLIASGNAGAANALDIPACISSAISVGSTGDGDQVSAFSNSAGFLDLLAPGESIESAVPGGGEARFAVKSGTSMAAPHAAGAFAVLRSARPEASVDELLWTLKHSGRPITDPRNALVLPRIQLDTAVNLLLADGMLALMLSPISGATLDAAVQTFRWTATDADEYWLELGGQPGSADLYSRSQGRATTATVAGLPTDGQALYVRLWTRVGADWYYSDHPYVAATAAD